MSEEYIRLINSSLERYTRPLEATTAPEDRGVVNELAFLLAKEAHVTQTNIRLIDSATVARLHDEARALLAQLRHFGRQGPRALSDMCIAESLDIATRIDLFLNHRRLTEPRFSPRFAGCGWVDTCYGDIVTDGELIEVKAGQRRFRSADVRQVLVYSALNFSAKHYDLESFCLLNPRMGHLHRSSLESLCSAISGRPAADVLTSIIEYVSRPMTEFAEIAQ